MGAALLAAHLLMGARARSAGLEPGLFLSFSSRRAQVVAWWCFAAAGSTVDLEQVNEGRPWLQSAARGRKTAEGRRLGRPIAKLVNNPG